MKKAGLGFLVLCFGSVGCVAERSCPEGERLEGDLCAPASVDGGMPDAGDAPSAVCTVPCVGDLPFCVLGTCVACVTDGDCAEGVCVDGACVDCRGHDDCRAGTPFCESAECVSCVDHECTADQLAGEVASAVCLGAAGAVRSSYTGTDLAQLRLEEDASTALVCSYPDQAPILGQILDAVRDGRTTVDLEALRACMDAAQRVSSGVALLGVLFCEGAFTGTQPNAGTCLGDFECASGFCRAPASGCGGTCAPQVAVGMPCVADGQCAGDASCVSSVCVADGPPTGAARGEACTYDYNCQAPLVCIEASSTCGDVPGDGMPCHDSVLYNCAEGTYCVSGTCRLRAELGERCPDQVSCVAGTQCAGSPSRCVPVAARGEACDDTVVCAVGTTCGDGWCEPWPDVGSPCSGACYRGTCIEGVCASLPVGRDCAPGFRPFDALDPCGDGVTCRQRAGEWECRATAATGEACGVDDTCDEPSATCSASDTCEPNCTL